MCCSTWGEGSIGPEVPGLWQLQLLGVPLESPWAVRAAPAGSQKNLAMSNNSSSAFGADRLSAAAPHMLGSSYFSQPMGPDKMFSL